MDVLIPIFLIVFLLGTLLVFIAVSMQKAAEAEYQQALASFETRFGKIDRHIIRPDKGCIGIDWDKDVLILGQTVASAEAIPLTIVREADIEIDGVNVTMTTGTTKTNRGSQLMGGAVGALALGPAGMVVGGLSGSSTTKSKAIEERNIRSIKLVVRVSDRAKPVRSLIFFEAPGEGVLAEALKGELEKAAHFHALLTNAVEDQRLPAA